MTISSVQIRMARAALGWGVRDLAAHASLSTETITRAEQSSSEITEKTWGALQRALEEAGIEFLTNTNSVTHHNDVGLAAICADPSMPLGIRRTYPRYDASFDLKSNATKQ